MEKETNENDNKNKIIVIKAFDSNKLIENLFKYSKNNKDKFSVLKFQLIISISELYHQLKNKESEDLLLTEYIHKKIYCEENYSNKLYMGYIIKLLNEICIVGKDEEDYLLFKAFRNKIENFDISNKNLDDLITFCKEIDKILSIRYYKKQTQEKEAKNYEKQITSIQEMYFSSLLADN